MVTEGIHKNLSSEEYHSHKESISRSALMDFNRSPFHYWAKHLNSDRPKKDATSSIILGSAFHTFILEPHLFADEYAIEPQKVLLKDVGRDAYELYKSQCELLNNTNKTILTAEEMKTLNAMKDNLFINEKAKELLTGGIIEQSYFWKDLDSGLILKSRPDLMHSEMYIDLKTCSDASPRAYQREMIDYGYHIQGAMVRDAIRVLENREMNNVINICVETKYPFTVAIYIIDQIALNHAENHYKNLAFELKKCLEKNEWQAYDIQTIGLPTWIK